VAAASAGSTFLAGGTQVPGPALPPRTYSRDPSLLVYRPAPLPKLPSQALPKFFNFLAYFILIAGSSATLLAVLYRTFVYPRLALLKARLTDLHHHDLSLFDKLLLSVHTLVDSNPKIYANTKQFITSHEVSLEVEPTAETTLPDAQDLEMENTGLKEEQATSEAEHSTDDLTPAPDSQADQPSSKPTVNITADLSDSLSRLSEKLQAYASRDVISSSKEDDEEEAGAKLPDPTPSQLLAKSLESLTAKLTNETFYSSAPSYASTYGYNYGAGAGVGGLPARSGMDKELMSKVKNDIRMLKGMFLTRRNFATPGKVETEAS